MNKTVATRLNKQKAIASNWYQQARAKPLAPPELELAWNAAREEIRLAYGAENEADVIERWSGVFFEFANFSVDQLNVLSTPVWTEPGIRERRRALLDGQPAILQFLIEHDKRMDETQRRLDATVAINAKQAHDARPSLILSRLREAGHDLTTDVKGRLYATPGADLDALGGVDVLRERKADLLAILKAEATALAEASKPVLI